MPWGHAFFAYADNYLIAIIIDVEATRANRRAEVGAARTMNERAEDCLGLCPECLAADMSALITNGNHDVKCLILFIFLVAGGGLEPPTPGL